MRAALSGKGALLEDFSIGSAAAALGAGRGFGFDEATLDWRARVLAYGGSVGATGMRAADGFVKRMRTAGIWPKLHRINLFGGNQLAAAVVPLKVGSGSAVDTNFNFVEGDYTEASGLAGNGSSKYLNTGVAVSALTTNDVHLGVYQLASSINTNMIIGCQGAGGGSQRLSLLVGSGPAPAFSAYSTGSAVSGSAASVQGHIVGTRTSSSEQAVYAAGASLATSASTGGSTPTATQITVFVNNANGTPSGYSNARLGAYHLGSGLTPADVLEINNALRRAMDAMGRRLT